MRITALVLVALTLSAGPAAAQQKETETVDRTIAFSRGGTLKLKNFSGDVRVTGTSGNDVVIHAVRTATRDRLDNIKLDIQVNGSTINVEANRKVPGWDETGQQRRRHALRDPGPVGDQPGPAGLLQRSHRARHDRRHRRAHLQRKHRSRRVEGERRSRPEGGNVQRRHHGARAAGSNGRVAFNTFSGDLRSDLPLVLHGKSRRNVNADLGSGGGSRLEFKTFSGDLRLVK